LFVRCLSGHGILPDPGWHHAAVNSSFFLKT
jgi:hypothetical protein